MSLVQTRVSTKAYVANIKAQCNICRDILRLQACRFTRNAAPQTRRTVRWNIWLGLSEVQLIYSNSFNITLTCIFVYSRYLYFGGVIVGDICLLEENRVLRSDTVQFGGQVEAVSIYRVYKLRCQTQVLCTYRTSLHFSEVWGSCTNRV